MTFRYLALPLLAAALFGQHTDLPSTGYSALNTAISTFLSFQTAAGAPSGKSCTVGKDVYTDTTSKEMYICSTTGTPGSWTKLAPAVSPSFTTPALGVATATSINGTTIPSSSTLVTTAAGNIAGTAAGLSGTPALPNGTTATTQSAADASTKVATTAYADTGLALKANLASPTFTGTPLSTTAAADTNTTQLATTAFYAGQKGTATPIIDGTAAAGSSLKFSPIDHVHPTDTSRAAAAATATVNSQTVTLGTTNTLTADPTSAQYKKLSCQPGLGDGLNAITAGTYLESTCYNDTGVTVTITAIKCFTDNSGTSALSVTNGAATALLTGAITCSSSFAAGTQSGTTTIASGDYLKFSWVADGTSKQTTWVVTETN